MRREAVEAVQRERALGKRKHEGRGDAVDDVGDDGDIGGDEGDAAYTEELARQINPFA